MSFLRALRAYIGLGPDAETEDRYLAELNARRRELDLAELHPDDVADEPRYLDPDYLDASPFEHDDGDRGYEEYEDFDDDIEVYAEDQPDWSDDEAEELAVSRARGGRSGGARRSGGRRRAAASADLDQLDEADELDLALIERLDRAGTRSGRHDIEPEDELESLRTDDGSETVRLRARSDDRWVADAGDGITIEFDDGDQIDDDPGAIPALEEADAEEGAVVRSLDARRAKPRTLMPESFADAKLVADEFKRDIPVVLNLQGVERDLARRLIDFASGICYVLDGSMEKIASQVFLLIPESLEVSEEDRRLIEERGYAR